MRRSGYQSALQKEKEDRPRTLCMAITRNREEAVGKPDVILDIKEVADIKMNALKAHRTQTEGMLRELEEKIKITSRFFRHGLKKKCIGHIRGKTDKKGIRLKCLIPFFVSDRKRSLLQAKTLLINLKNSVRAALRFGRFQDGFRILSLSRRAFRVIQLR